MHKPEHYLQLALEQARLGVQAGNRPYGAVIVDSHGNIVSMAHNTVHTQHDVTHHAEINALRLALTSRPSHKLPNLSLYTTAEPCLMCIGAIIWARLSHVYFGIDLEQLNQLGFEQIMIPDSYVAQHSPWPIQVHPHILHQEVVDFYTKYASTHFDS